MEDGFEGFYAFVVVGDGVGGGGRVEVGDVI